jgi:hypothetical protein
MLNKTGWCNEEVVINVHKIDMPYVLANICILQNSKYKNLTVSLNDVTNQAAGRSDIREQSRIYYFHII